MHSARIVASTVMLAATVPAAATITVVDFRGTGAVTHSRVGSNPEITPQPTPPLVGTPVAITGTLDLGLDGIADDFTGIFTFDDLELFFGGQAFRWGVAGGGSGASTFGGAAAAGYAYAYGNATFALGRLTGLGLYVDYDGDDHSLFTTAWGTSYSYQDADWGGTWALAVPEPASWALMIVGFGLVGTAARRRRRAAA